MTNKAFFWPSQKNLATKPTVFAKSKEKTCLECKLHLHCNSPKMEATGKGKKGILIIAEAPGAEEDARGLQLVGAPGKLLRKELARHKINLDLDCIKINAISCCPPKNRKPKPLEVEACRARVWSVIRKHKPKLILLLGNTAIESFLGHRWKKDLGGITRWRGWCIPDQDVQAWVCPTYHPSFLLHPTTNEVAHVLFRKDLKAAIRCLKKPFPKRGNDLELVRVLRKQTSITSYLQRMINNPPKFMAFDYETTGLKPQAKGQRIVSISFCIDPKKAVAFLYHKRYRKLIATLLHNRRIKKIASNIKFEMVWTKDKIGCDVRGCFWDTMLYAHCVDNRRGITSLKFQTYVQFGVVDYASEVAPYLVGINERDGNSLNRIMELTKNKEGARLLLQYNALDSLYEFWLAFKQMDNKGRYNELCK